MTRIVVDSTLDLPQDTMTELGIEMMPLMVHFGDQAFRDKIDLDSEEFFARPAFGQMQSAESVR